MFQLQKPKKLNTFLVTMQGKQEWEFTGLQSQIVGTMKTSSYDYRNRMQLLFIVCFQFELFSFKTFHIDMEINLIIILILNMTVA